ncbi:MAG: ABC transporter ATP-binding protein [Chloroflexi bacterium]|nr:ABC transporter ATP-binding protein [Chloroflexota bacterium]
MEKILEVKNLVVEYPLKSGILDFKVSKSGISRLRPVVHAVNDVSFSIKQGEVFALVGESGCGKSTVAKAIVKLIDKKSGQILFRGDETSAENQDSLNEFRRNIQMIFQDPYSSLNPRQKVKDIIGEPIAYHRIRPNKASVLQLVSELMEKVGLSNEMMERYPHQFSGGQRQRIGIARALSMNPSLIIADEPVSALDVSIQAQILNLLMDLKDEFNLSILMIAHDLSVVKHISDRIGIMYLGKIVESGEKDQIFAEPKHPYTRALFSAIPIIEDTNPYDPIEIIGEVPSARMLPSGCFYHTRCPLADEKCIAMHPELVDIDDDHFVSCYHWQKQF